jgi:glyoxylase-like metal-dependent hydrolase (beta-lactamase superfamily II)
VVGVSQPIVELPAGIRRVTLPLPMRPGHVHAYLVPGDDGWLVVDTGLGLPDAKERWEAELRTLEGEVTRLFITHFHPDHVGAARDVIELTGATAYQGALDLEQCVRVWQGSDWPEVLTQWFGSHGAPDDVTDELIESGSYWTPFVRFAPEATPMEPGSHLDGWEIVAAPGHADGQLTLLREGVLLAADHLLDRITPTVGLWPASRPDPLGDYVLALETVIARAPTIALPGHGEPILDPPGRAREIIDHHGERLDATVDTLATGSLTAFDVSLTLFGRELKPAARRFAIAETLSHLEYLVHRGIVQRHEAGGRVTYTHA